MNKRRCVGILGGTFDPPHWGHLRLAEHFSRLLQLDQIIWLPTGQSWQKEGVTSAQARLAMSEYAVETLHDLFLDHHIYTKIEISTLEMDRQGPSYTIDTVKELRALYVPETSLSFLMGEDSWAHLHTWNDWQQLTDYVHLAIASRPGKHPEAPATGLLANKMASDPTLLQSAPSGSVWLDRELQIDLASSDLRPALAKTTWNDAVYDGIPPQVLEYIEQHDLYRNG